MKTKIYTATRYILFTLFVVLVQCKTETEAEPEISPLELDKENSVTLPSISSNKLQLEVGASLTIDIGDAKDALERDIPPELLSLTTDLIDASLTDNKLLIKGLKAGVLDIKVQWTAKATQIQKDDNDDGVDDNITYEEKTEEAVIGITVVPAPVINTPSLPSSVQQSYVGKINEIIKIYIPKATDKLGNSVSPIFNKYSDIIESGGTVGVDDTMRVKIIKQGKDFLEVHWPSKNETVNSGSFDTQYKSDTLKMSINIQTENTPPSVPKLSILHNTATAVPLNTKLVWSASTDGDGDAVTYDVFLGTDNPPTTKVSSGQAGVEYTPSGQANATTYYWKVVAKDGKDETSSEVRSYTTISLNNAPTKPVLTTPNDAATSVTLNTKLVWGTSTDGDGDAVTYDVFLGTNNPPTTKVSSGQAGVEYTPTGQSGSTTYYWKVVAKDGKDETSSEVRSYTTVSLSSAPTKPSLTSPNDAATSVTLNTKLVWGASTDSDGDAVKYDVFLGTNNPPTTKVSSGQAGVEYTPTGQSGSTTYYWKVIAKSGGDETSSDLRSYTTVSLNNAPTKPVLTTPNDAATSVTVNTKLVWGASTDSDGDAVKYDVFLGTNNPPTTKVSSEQAGVEYTPTGQSGSTTYYWKIQAKDGTDSVSSDVRSYTTSAVNNPPSKPALTLPSDASNVQLSTKLEWTASTDPEIQPVTYDVYIGTTSPPTTKVSSAQTSLEYTPSGQSNSTTYYWKVIASDGTNITSSDIWSFTTSPAGVSSGSDLMFNGKTYPTTVFGSKTWMDLNLNDDSHTAGNSTCYDNDDAKCTNNGRLYDWAAANDIASKVPGWHLPTDDDWKDLEKDLGMSTSDANDTGFRGTIEGAKIKFASSSSKPVLTGKYDPTTSTFSGLSTEGRYWSATPVSGSANTYYYRGIYSSSNQIERDGASSAQYYSVRLVKD